MIAGAATVVAAVLLIGCLRALRRALPGRPTAFDAALRASPAPADPVTSLAEAERVVSGAISNAGDAHWRLRPILRDVVGSALHARGIHLNANPAAARALVGEDTSELVRPHCPRPDDPFAPGIPFDALDRMLRSVERLEP